MIRRAARVHGAVQGVGFRYRTCEQAQRLGVTGWVRNNRDGTVSLEAQGPDEAVDELLRWAASGPRHATVTRIDVARLPPLDDESGFDVG